jgi:hypothetical protein
MHIKPGNLYNPAQFHAPRVHTYELDCVDDIYAQARNASAWCSKWSARKLAMK